MHMTTSIRLYICSSNQVLDENMNFLSSVQLNFPLFLVIFMKEVERFLWFPLGKWKYEQSGSVLCSVLFLLTKMKVETFFFPAFNNTWMTCCETMFQVTNMYGYLHWFLWIKLLKPTRQLCFCYKILTSEWQKIEYGRSQNLEWISLLLMLY